MTGTNPACCAFYIVGLKEDMGLARFGHETLGDDKYVGYLAIEVCSRQLREVRANIYQNKYPRICGAQALLKVLPEPVTERKTHLFFDIARNDRGLYKTEIVSKLD